MKGEEEGKVKKVEKANKKLRALVCISDTQHLYAKRYVDLGTRFQTYLPIVTPQLRVSLAVSAAARTEGKDILSAYET